jgi:TonB family protein
MGATYRGGLAIGRWPWVACLGVALAGCASVPTTGDASHHATATGDLRHYPLALGQVSTGAVPHQQPAPVYPPALLDQRLGPREVEARLIVDEAGQVTEVRITGEAQADPTTRLFDEAVRSAAMQWTFAPLHVSQWAADANGNTHEVGGEERPFSMDYVFRFAWKDGKPAADASASPHTTK